MKRELKQVSKIIGRIVLYLLLPFSLALYSISNYQFPITNLVEHAYADELAEIEKELAELSEKLEMSRQATAPLESTLGKLEQDLTSLQGRIENLSVQVVRKEKQVSESEENLSEQQLILEKRIREFYKRDSRLSDAGLKLFLGGGESFARLARLTSYNQKVLEKDRNQIVQLVLFIKNLEEKKRELEDEKSRLAVVKEETDRQAAFFRQEVRGAKEYQAQLSSKIAELTARQKQLLTEKTQLFSTSVGDVPLSADPASRPDYNPGFSPAFAAFSFGAPHFKGMSQYGAYGRAKEGQTAEDILRAYYGGGIEIKKDYSTDITINVEGFGGFNIEDYTKRIYEMPSSWGDKGGMEALKAQAIAARSYALARTNNGAGSICATEHCQVFKPSPKGGKWEEAVNATRGWVLFANGQPFSAWYASTSGGYQESYSHNGYSTPGFWDTKNGRDGWTSQAYEKIAGSPWFYKGWYKTRSGKSCGRGHPWLNADEFADIVNAAVVYTNGGDVSGIFPVDVQSCFGDSDEPWSRDRLAREADKHGGRVTSVSDISVQYASNGVTAKVHIGTNRGTLTLDGQDFYKVFNLRAPSAIHLKSGLYNIERK